MITYFLYDLLPLWLGKLGRIARDSALYRLAAGLWRFPAKLVRESCCARLWQGSDRLRTRIEGSRPFAWFDAVIRWMTEFAGKVFGFLVDPVCDSRLVTILGRMPRFNFGWLYGIVFLIMYLIPGAHWNNLYALGFSCLLFLSLLLDAWKRGEAALRARELGVGLLLNRQYRIWDYRNVPLNFLGQICLPYTLLWMPVGLAGAEGYRLLDKKMMHT